MTYLLFKLKKDSKKFKRYINRQWIYFQFQVRLKIHGSVPGSCSSTIITSHDIAIGAASDNAMTHMKTMMTFAIRFDVCALK